MCDMPTEQITETPSEDAKLQRVTNFDIKEYLPFNIIFTEMLMYRVGRPDQHSKVKALIDISQGESRVLTFMFSGQAKSPTDLTENLNMDRSLVTRNISALEKKELITIRKDPSDKRRRLLNLTDKGNEVAIELVSVYANFNDFLNDAITANEKRTIIKILDKLNKACDQYSG